MNAYERAAVEDAAIQFAKAVPHTANKGGNDPRTHSRFREQTADQLLTERGYVCGPKDSEECHKWHQLIREVVRIGALMAAGKYQMTARLKTKANKMRNSGVTSAQIGVALGYAESTISRHFARMR